MGSPQRRYRRPESVLVVVHTTGGKVLLLRRNNPADFWQSVTGGLRDAETPRAAALRELAEETGSAHAGALRDLHLTYRYPIHPAWRERYAPEVSENLEHVFALALPAESAIRLNRAEHVEYAWLDIAAAAARVASWSNRAAILRACRPETVILLHGLWVGAWSLALFRQRLRRRGFAVTTVAYPSVAETFAQIAARVQRAAAAIDAEVVHWVGHSLGGLVIRAVFHHHPDQRPGRIVTLGTPHAGSETAALLARSAPGRRIVGRCLHELLCGVPAHWRAPARDVGSIAGGRSLGVGRLLGAGLARPNDGTVAVAETMFPGVTDHLVLPATHTGLLLSAAAARQACQFLRHGRFDPPPAL